MDTKSYRSVPGWTPDGALLCLVVGLMVGALDVQARRSGLETPAITHQFPSMWMEAGWLEMADNIRELRSRSSDSEKITINLGYVDLGHIDLLVQEGFYSNRTDFIRTAIRNQLDRQNESVRQSVARHQLELGLRHYSREDLEAVEAAGDTLHIQVLGLASIADDVSPELALRTLASIHVLGALRISPTLKAALSHRIR